MREEKELVADLCAAARLVNDALEGQISLEEFVRKYGNFYYYQALDGHEADTQTANLLKKYRDLVVLHEDIQTKVVDAVYLGPQTEAEKFVTVGRIQPRQAFERIAEIAQKHDLGYLLTRLCADSRG